MQTDMNSSSQPAENRSEIDGLLQALEEAANRGRRAIEDGDWARNEVEDAEFARIVPAELEDKVIAAMVSSGRWNRCGDGFNLIRPEAVL